MSTYIPDQWLRNWFVGGSSCVQYKSKGQLAHSSPEEFSENLNRVWRNAYESCSKGATMVIRFGGLSDRNVNTLDIIKCSLLDTGWKITTARPAGSANEGQRQANTFLRKKSDPIIEYDVWSTRK